jgi:hypothetical protein
LAGNHSLSCYVKPKRSSKIWKRTEPAGSRAVADGADYIEGASGRAR